MRGGADALAAAWESIRASLRRSIGARTFDGWLKPLGLGECDLAAGTLQLVAPSDFMANWVNTHFADQLGQAWRALLPQIGHVGIVADGVAGRPVLFSGASLAPAEKPIEASVAVTVSPAPETSNTSRASARKWSTSPVA